MKEASAKYEEFCGINPLNKSVSRKVLSGDNFNKRNSSLAQLQSENSFSNVEYDNLKRVSHMILRLRYKIKLVGNHTQITVIMVCMPLLKLSSASVCLRYNISHVKTTLGMIYNVLKFFFMYLRIENLVLLNLKSASQFTWQEPCKNSLSGSGNCSSLRPHSAAHFTDSKCQLVVEWHSEL